MPFVPPLLPLLKLWPLHGVFDAAKLMQRMSSLPHSQRIQVIRIPVRYIATRLKRLFPLGRQSAAAFLPLLITLVLWSSPTLSLAASSLPPGLQAYSERPDILSVTPRNHGFGLEPKIRRAHLEAAAQILELYPDREIYFLARDAELLYDTARILARSEPSILSRLHLLNISLANVEDVNLRAYLAQEGISGDRVWRGDRFVFIDTGFEGTISRTVVERLPFLDGRILTHLMCSNNREHPSSRIFLRHFNASVSRLPAWRVRGNIESYEHLPRFTDKSYRFQQVGGRWEPVSDRNTQSDGRVDPSRAVVQQEDLAHYLSTDEARQIVAEQRQLWRQ